MTFFALRPAPLLWSVRTLWGSELAGVLARDGGVLLLLPPPPPPLLCGPGPGPREGKAPTLARMSSAAFWRSSSSLARVWAISAWRRARRAARAVGARRAEAQWGHGA